VIANTTEVLPIQRFSSLTEGSTIVLLGVPGDIVVVIGIIEDTVDTVVTTAVDTKGEDNERSLHSQRLRY